MKRYNEELAKEPNIPMQCVDGSCPMAWSEEYEERGMDVVHSCAECPYQPSDMNYKSDKYYVMNSIGEVCGYDLNLFGAEVILEAFEKKYPGQGWDIYLLG